MSLVKDQLLAANKAKLIVKNMSDDQKVRVIKKIGKKLSLSIPRIIQENGRDLALMDKNDPKYDRLILSEERILSLISSLYDISGLPDPAGQLQYTKKLDNGLFIEKRTVPLGVVGVIYESRPNVTVDVAALCIRSGNACLLRGGSDAWYTNSILVQMIQEVLEQEGFDVNIVQLLPVEREGVLELLHSDKYVDIIIPRGSQGLIDFVRENSKVPVIETGAGVCHTYVERSADLKKAVDIVHNAKVSRPSVCNALDTVLVDESVAADFLRDLAPLYAQSEVEIRADNKSYSILKQLNYPYLTVAGTDDFGQEFLSLCCSVKVVSSSDEAFEHILKHSSKHSECIVSEDPEIITDFLNDVDAAAVYSNASTRFTDGGVFGLGAEIGISTQKLHARGPFALEKLVTEKWIIKGEGQIRL